jgi:peroxiredoxin
MAFSAEAQKNIGKQYPEFNFTTIKGETISTATAKGKVTLVNFWFKDCSPCRAEMEWLNELYDSLKSNPDFQFISIARETKDVLPGYVNFFKIQYPVVSLVDCYKYNYNSGFPTNIIIDKQGKVAFYKSGGNPDRAKSKAEVLETLLPKIKSLL